MAATGPPGREAVHVGEGQASGQLSTLDTRFYYSRIMTSDPSTRPDRFGLRLSPRDKAIVLYMLAHNMSYPTTLNVAVRYRHRMREAIGLVLGREEGNGFDNADPVDYQDERDIFDAVFDAKLKHLIKYLWGLCRKHGVLSAPALRWGGKCAWDGPLVKAHMGTVDDAARWLEGVRAAAQQAMPVVETQAKTRHAAEQKGEGAEGGCKTRGPPAPATASEPEPEPDIMGADVDVPCTLGPAAVGPVMEQLAQGIAHLSISCAGGDCPHSCSPSPIYEEERRGEEEEEQNMEYESALGTGSMLGGQHKRQPSVPASRGLQHSRWAGATW